MVDRSAAIHMIEDFIQDLIQAGYSPKDVYLFGSYAHGQPHDFSDIDVAVWDANFSGCLARDVEQVKSVLARYAPIELHPFNLDDDEDPWAQTIRSQGIRIPSINTAVGRE
ncbi:Nucleotidyltransferase domain-containing protein [Desulfonatronum zhilinae]|nr:Nucleotidyltransferase domain-containing protein [Desulfonatronum zhilinae]